MDVPQLTLPEVKENVMCFGCGKANPMSLKIKLSKEGDIAKAEFTPKEHHQGWPGYAHGGTIMTFIDECIGYTCVTTGVFTVTAEIDIRLKSMAKIGEPLTAFARVVKKTKRLLEIAVDVRRPDGSVVAEASSVQFVVQTHVAR